VLHFLGIRVGIAAIVASLLMITSAQSDPPEGTIRANLAESPARQVARNPTITPEMRAEIERVATTPTPGPAVAKNASSRELVTSGIRCASFEGLRYCLGVGWTTESEQAVQRRVAKAMSKRATGRAANSTGDLSADAVLAARAGAGLGSDQREAADREELTLAAASVAKVWQIEHEVRGTPLPEGFAARHPEFDSDSAKSGADRRKKFPRKDKVLSAKRVVPQIRDFWCGVATTRMIVLGWKKKKKVAKQTKWASRLGTTSEGTDITQMVNAINKHTGFDSKKYAGPYTVIGVNDYSYREWIRLVKRQIHDKRSPLVLHPILLKKFFPYLSYDGSGHFQVGRGYQKRGDKSTEIGYFEPWNPRRFNPASPFVKRVQWRSAYASYRANRAHPLQNIGL
jgi:hypothetical protein